MTDPRDLWHMICPATMPFKSRRHDRTFPKAAVVDTDHFIASCAIRCPACFQRRWFTNDNSYFQQSPDPLDSFAMLMPEPRIVDAGAALPLPVFTVLDRYQYVIHDSSRTLASSDITAGPDHLGLDPFLGAMPFGLGGISLYRTDAFVGLTEFARQIWVLDGSTLPFSHTMKDVRSAGILYGCRHLGLPKRLVLWTAGNAGASLSTAVHHSNQCLDDCERIDLASLVYAETPGEIIQQLIHTGSRVESIGTRGAILTRRQTRQIGRAMLECDDKTPIMDVSDGWDGLGTCMYRLVIYNALRKATDVATENNKPTLRSAPHFVVVPLGTGNLLLGAYLAIQDFRDWLEVNEFEHFIVPVAAIAFGKENLLSVMRLDADWSPWSRWHEHWEPRKSNDNRAMVLAPKPPLAPKVTGVYSPLAAWINREVWVGETVFVEVDQSDQITARACMRPHRPVRGQIGSAEPSALLAFAALPGLEAWLKAEHQRPPERRRAASMGGRQLPEVSKARILVVNTGSGAVSSLEQDFLTQIPKKS